MPKSPLGIREIQEFLPHRYPILMVDRVLELDDKIVIAEKLISVNEPVLMGHFPDRPVFPGVLILEALAQAAGVWAMSSLPQFRDKQPALVGIDKARFRRPVVPGDTLRLECRVTRRRGPIIRFEGVARVDGETGAEAQLLAAFVDWEDGE